MTWKIQVGICAIVAFRFRVQARSTFAKATDSLINQARSTNYIGSHQRSSVTLSIIITFRFLASLNSVISAGIKRYYRESTQTVI